MNEKQQSVRHKIVLLCADFADKLQSMIKAGEVTILRSANIRKSFTKMKESIYSYNNYGGSDT